MSMRNSIIAAVLLSVMAAGPAHAWNSRGHMIVAAVAWDNLSQKSKDRVTALLKLNPQYASWTSGVAATKKAKVAFMKAATWPDYIRSAAGYHDGEPENETGTGYGDKYRHQGWHYKDIPFSPDGTATQEASEPNAQTQIDAFVEALNDGSVSDEQKSYDMTWLLHLVGDVHQPLHATSRFVATDTNGDNGGNDVKVCVVACPSSKALHSFWDQALGGSENIESVIAKANALPSAPASKVADLDVGHWLHDSFSLAKSVVYQAPVRGKLGPYQLTETYKVKAGSTAEKQVALAGARLAKILNSAFDD